MSWLKFIFLPSKLILLILLIAVICLLWRRYRRYAPHFFSAAALLYVAFSSGIVASLLLSPLEYRYPAVTDPAAHNAVKSIVVLDAYIADDPLMPLSGKFNPHVLFRLVEAQNIYKQCKGCRILLSGRARNVELMQQQLLLMGVLPADIEMEAASLHTVESAANLVHRLGSAQFFLVTSAGHMPRSMGVFLNLGLKPIAAPTDYLMPKQILNASPWPSSEHLNYSDLAINEYAGILWYRLNGKL